MGGMVLIEGGSPCHLLRALQNLYLNVINIRVAKVGKITAKINIGVQQGCTISPI
jgi:hypothetical protein